MEGGNSSNLAVGERGPYAELSAKPNPDNLILLYIPAVSLLIERGRQLKGADLNADQIGKIRSQSPVVAMKKEDAEHILKQRGGIE
jgi:hypothetical protein